MLYLIRHGLTGWNSIHKLQGSTNVPLNDEGREMARKLKEEIKDLNFDICFMSPLDRASETAEIILEGRNIPVYKDDRLKELSFGEFEGATGFFTEPDHPLYVLFHEPEKYVATNNVESIEELSIRANDFIKDKIYPEIKDGKDVLIVAHGAINVSIYNNIHGIPIERFWENLVPNCGMLTIEDDDVLAF